MIHKTNSIQNPALTPSILWFRRDLRLDDNPALAAALSDGAPIIPVYIHAPEEESPWEPGAASRWWLHWSLTALDASLRARGNRLWILRGPSLDALRRLAHETGARTIRWNRLYDPATRERDTRIKQTLRAEGLHCESHKAALLFEPWEVLNGSGQPYRVFSAFWRACMRSLSVPPPAPPRRPFRRRPPPSRRAPRSNPNRWICCRTATGMAGCAQPGHRARQAPWSVRAPSSPQD